MGLDQLLFQGVDGTLWRGAAEISVVPFIPRTQTVWSSQCTNEWGGPTIDAMVYNNVRVQLLQMWNLDRGVGDVKFGPLVWTPSGNGFTGGVLSSAGSCPCGWNFSFYHILIKLQTSYYIEIMSLPANGTSATLKSCHVSCARALITSLAVSRGKGRRSENTYKTAHFVTFWLSRVVRARPLSHVCSSSPASQCSASATYPIRRQGTSCSKRH
jgi:hypothetical protein